MINEKEPYIYDPRKAEAEARKRGYKKVVFRRVSISSPINPIERYWIYQRPVDPELEADDRILVQDFYRDDRNINDFWSYLTRFEDHILSLEVDPSCVSL